MDMDKKIHIDVYSHNFSVKCYKQHHHEMVAAFSWKLVKWTFFYNRKTGRNEKIADSVYASSTSNRSIIRYHINFLDEFMEHLKSYGVNDEVIILTRHSPEDIVWDNTEIKLLDGISPRENQLTAIDYVLDPNIENRIKLVTLGTGVGKTFVSLYSAFKKQIRFILFVRSQYIERWITGVKEVYDITDDEILIISGSESLKRAFMLKENNLLDGIKFIAISNRTFQRYLNEYESHGDDILQNGWTTLPYNFAEALNARWVFIDENHQDFHLYYRIMTYMHCERSVSLTATLMSDDKFIQKMYNKTFPPESRLPLTAPKKYIAGYGVMYNISRSVFFKNCISNRGYNHVKFEKVIMKHSKFRINYFNLINKVIKYGYLDKLKPGHKCIIFVATVQMATALTNYLNEKYPNLNIKRYTSDDPNENLIEPDIRVTTINSSGTAVDIPGLSCSILTHVLSGSQINIQVLGRLREMKDGTTPSFFWFTCLNISKHMEYHEKKLNELFRNRLKVYNQINTGIYI
jgi:superfamily II DNA or RNA helicase